MCMKRDAPGGDDHEALVVHQYSIDASTVAVDAALHAHDSLLKEFEALWLEVCQFGHVHEQHGGRAELTQPCAVVGPKQAAPQSSRQVARERAGGSRRPCGRGIRFSRFAGRLTSLWVSWGILIVRHNDGAGPSFGQRSTSPLQSGTRQQELPTSLHAADLQRPELPGSECLAESQGRIALDPPTVEVSPQHLGTAGCCLGRVAQIRAVVGVP